MRSSRRRPYDKAASARGGQPTPMKHLQVLCAAASHISTDGLLAPAKLDAVCSACERLLYELYGPKGCVIASVAWTDMRLRPALLKLASHAVRNIAARPVTSTPLWVKWHSPFVLLTNLLSVFLGMAASKTADCCSVELDLIRQLLRLDYLPCLSQAAAAMAADAAADAVMGFSVIQGEGLVAILALFAALLFPLASHQTRRAYIKVGMMEAISDARLLEHSARALVLLSGRHMMRNPRCEDTRSYLIQALQKLGHVLTALTVTRGDDCDGRLERWGTRLLANTSVQHLLLVHTLAQICAADGGPTYGLPLEGSLPPLYCDLHADSALLAPPTEHQEVARGGAGGAILRAVDAARRTLYPQEAEAATTAAAAIGAQPPPLATKVLTDITDFWLHCISHDVEPLPCAGAELRTLCLRLAEAANDEMEAQRRGAEGDQDEAAAPAAVTAATEVADAAAGRGGAAAGPRPGRFHGPDCMWLAFRALMCAVGSCDKERRALEGRIWSPVVRAVNNGLLCREARGFIWTGLRELLRPRLPTFPFADPLPLEPPPDLAAALAAGYVPCTERYLRRTCGDQTLDGAMRVERTLAELYPVIRVFGLLAYGEPRSVGTYMATGAKLLKRVVAVAAAPWRPETDPYEAEDRAGLLHNLDCFLMGMNVISGLSSHLQLDFPEHILKHGNGPQDLWWLAVTGGDGGGDGGGTGPGGSGGGQAMMNGVSSPTERLLLLATWTVSCWLPVVARAAVSCHHLALSRYAPRSVATAALSAASSLAGVALTWASIAGVAALKCCDVRDAGDARARAGAASWRKLLIQRMDLMGLLRSQLGALAHIWQLQGNIAKRADILAAVMLKVAPILPQELRRAMAEPLPSGDGAVYQLYRFVGLSAGEVLKMMLGPEAKDMYRAAMEVADDLCEGGRGPAGEYEERVGMAEQDGDVLVGRVLPPPCVAAGALRLPGCSYDWCISLEGDSDAALEVHACGGRCGGAVSYCSRECQRAHWNAGHKEECGLNNKKK